MIEREPQLEEEKVQEIFGDCKYSCQVTHDPSYFHTILTEKCTIYIEEWLANDMVLATIFNKETQDDKMIVIEDTIMNNLLIKIKNHIQ